MVTEDFPIGMRIDVSYPDFDVNLSFLSETRMMFEIKKGPFLRTETVEIDVVSLANGLFAVSWQESDGSTVTNVQDYDRGVIHSHITLPDRKFLRMMGTIAVASPTDRSTDARPIRNKAIVLDAMVSLFQRHDIQAVDRLYASDYVQHNQGIAQGRAALRALVEALPSNIFYEPGLIIAEGEYVAIHGRIVGWAERPQITVDMFRLEQGKLAEHWDVMQDEVVSDDGPSMFDPREAPVARGRPD